MKYVYLYKPGDLVSFPGSAIQPQPPDIKNGLWYEGVVKRIDRGRAYILDTQSSLAQARFVLPIDDLYPPSIPF